MSEESKTSQLEEAFSPPVVVALPSGETLSFRRMLMKHWAEMQSKTIAHRLKSANESISKMEKSTWQEKAAARAAAESEVRETLTLRRLMHDCANDPQMIIMLLDYALVGGRREAIELIPPLSQSEIAEQIVFAPVIQPDPPKPSDNAADVAGNPFSQATSETDGTIQSGENLAGSSRDSTELIPQV